METDIRLIAPVAIYDPINQEETYSVPVRVIQISDNVCFDFTYDKNGEDISPPCRHIVFEMCNKYSQLEEFTGYMWEASYQKLIIENKISIPFLSLGSFIKDVDLNYSLLVHSERRFLSAIPVPNFNSIQDKTEYIVSVYWSFFMWAQENLPEYWNE